MQLECFAVHPNPPEMVPGRTERAWMNRVAGRVPYRCLPMTIANSTGWEIICPFAFEAEWGGGTSKEAIRIFADQPHESLVISHFAYGILTFHTGYLFRTPPGWAVMASGAPNHVKHGIQALQGIIETDWLPFPFTMNWMFTAPGRIRFEKDEPFCFVNLIEMSKIEQFTPVVRQIETDPELQAQYMEWNRSRVEFNTKTAMGDHEAMKQSWQKHYFQGKYQEPGKLAPQHISKRHIKTPH